MVSAIPYSVSYRDPGELVCTVNFDHSDIELINLSSGLRKCLRRTKHLALRLMLSEILERWTRCNIGTPVTYEYTRIWGGDEDREAVTAQFGAGVAW